MLGLPNVSGLLEGMGLVRVVTVRREVVYTIALYTRRNRSPLSRSHALLACRLFRSVCIDTYRIIFMCRRITQMALEMPP